MALCSSKRKRDENYDSEKLCCYPQPGSNLLCVPSCWLSCLFSIQTSYLHTGPNRVSKKSLLWGKICSCLTDRMKIKIPNVYRRKLTFSGTTFFPLHLIPVGCCLSPSKVTVAYGTAACLPSTISSPPCCHSSPTEHVHHWMQPWAQPKDYISQPPL